MSSKSLTILELAALAGAELSAEFKSSQQAQQRISRIASLTDARSGDASFLSNPKLVDQLRNTQASVVFVRAADVTAVPATSVALILKDPYLAYARASQYWANAAMPGIHPQAYVAPSARVAATASISAFAYVGEGAVIGERTVLHPRATVLDHCVVGSDCILHSGAVIGADGFGFAREADRWVKIAQLGKVVIEDEVEIGANTTIDRGAINDTRLCKGVKLDNQIQIAHNVVIGENTAIAACVGIAGSTIIGKRCTIGGAAGIIGHLTIADDVHISAFTLVQSSIKKPGHYTGVYPLEEHAAWEKNAATLRQLSKLRDRVRSLEHPDSSE